MYYALHKWECKTGKCLGVAFLSLTPDEVKAMFDCDDEPPVYCYEVKEKHVERLQKDIPDETFSDINCSWTVEAEADVHGEIFDGFYLPPGLRTRDRYEGLEVGV